MTTAQTPSATGFTPKKLYFVLAIAEAVTWTLLITGLILRGTVGIEPWLFTTFGGIHGFIFLSYGATAVLVSINQRWHPGVAILAVITAIVPYATIPFDRYQSKRGALDGPWRLEETDDPRDKNWFDRFVRWFLNRPLLLVLALVVAVVVIFSVLLFIGPPGGK